MRRVWHFKASFMPIELSDSLLCVWWKSDFKGVGPTSMIYDITNGLEAHAGPIFSILDCYVNTWM